MIVIVLAMQALYRQCPVVIAVFQVPCEVVASECTLSATSHLSYFTNDASIKNSVTTDQSECYWSECLCDCMWILVCRCFLVFRNFLVLILRVVYKNMDINDTHPTSTTHAEPVNGNSSIARTSV